MFLQDFVSFSYKQNVPKKEHIVQEYVPCLPRMLVIYKKTRKLNAGPVCVKKKKVFIFVTD